MTHGLVPSFSCEPQFPGLPGATHLEGPGAAAPTFPRAATAAAALMLESPDGQQPSGLVTAQWRLSGHPRLRTRFVWEGLGGIPL
ncbi:hypothetical protein PSEUDO8Z_110022 [Pseudomonas sp. 8Z]|nr:hypothetical protein PSEUDO8Z_110022 [Pseudomonas sp. 8Z]